MAPSPTGTVGAPAPGAYPVPGHHHGEVVERSWDGDVWLEDSSPAPDGTKLAGYRRHVTRFLHDRGWLLVLVFLVVTIAGGVIWQVAPDREHVEGIQLLLPPLAIIGTLISALALYRLIGGRVRFEQIGAHRAIIGWGIASGIVGVGIGAGIELGVPKLFGAEAKDPAWDWIAGPAEETGKLVLPVILWFSGRFRLPRQGLLLVLMSGFTFAVIESTEYALSPEGWSPSRPAAEMMHPLFTGLVAAVAWRHAWGRRSWFTATALAAWVAAMALHSFNDGVAADDLSFTGSSAVTPVTMIVAYLLLKHGARQLVPPDWVERVSRRWRPVAPRRSAG